MPFSYAPVQLAAERQQPMTGAEQAAADGREAEYARDVPRGCPCVHRFNRGERRYEALARRPGCPWHTKERDDDGI